MQQPRKSILQRLKISNAYGQLIALIFVPIMVLAITGAVLVLEETAHSIQSQQRSSANITLVRYQHASIDLVTLLKTPNNEFKAQSIFAYILSEPDLVRAAIINNQEQVLLKVGAKRNLPWPSFSKNEQFVGPIKTKGGNIYGLNLNFDSTKPTWLFIELNNQPLSIAKYRIWLVLSVTSLFTLLLLLLCLNFYSRRWIAPMYEMRLQLQNINAETLGRRFVTRSTGELALLQNDIAKVFKRLNLSFIELKEYADQTEDDLRKTLDTLEVQNITYKQARDQAISANQSKSAFLANISHELRTPLNSIDGFINLMLRRGHLTDENLMYVQTIHKSSAHLLALINDVLDFSKIDAGKLELEKIEFNLEEAIFDVLDMLSPLAAEKSIDMAIYFDESLPTQVIGDGLRFRQILTNLVSNAIKFTPEGEIIVRTRLEQRNSKTFSMHCSVQDSGVGLSGSDRKKLFDSFSQGDTSVTRQFGGTGLGLAISKQLTQLMHGEIGFVDNQDRNPTDKGATFWFTITLDLPAQQPVIHQDLSKHRVLSYISHPATANILKNYLENYNAQHSEATSILDLFSQLSNLANYPKENTWVIVDHVGDNKALLKEVRTRYQGNLAIYGYQVLLDPKILHQYQAIGLNQPLSRKSLLNLFYADQLKPKVESFNGHGLHILAVDDHLPNLIVLEALLGELNVKVSTALNGQIALNHIQSCLDLHTPMYDLIFMDIQMPVMSGIETTQAIRALEYSVQEISTLPIIALTAHAMADEKDRILKAGFNDYVTKPIQLEQIISILKTWTSAGNPSVLDHSHSILATQEPMPVLDEHVLDWDKSLALAANKEDLAKDLLTMMITSFDKESAEMQQLIEDEDFPQLEHNLHRLYGATRYVGTPHLQDVSGEFEQFVSRLRKEQRVADATFIQEVNLRFEQLLQAMQSVRHAAQRYLNPSV